LILIIPKEQVTTPQERRPTGICPDETVKEAGYDASRMAHNRDVLAPLLFNIYLWRDNHRLQKVSIRWRPSNHACWWRLAGIGRGA